MLFFFAWLFNEVMFNTAKEIYCWLRKTQNQNQSDVLTEGSHILLNDEGNVRLCYFVVSRKMLTEENKKRCMESSALAFTKVILLFSSTTQR